MELSSSNMKKFLKFSQSKAFLIFPETKIRENFWYSEKFLIFPRKNAFLMFQETKTPRSFLYFRKRKFLIFQEVTFRYRKIETVSYISGIGTSYISGGASRTPKIKIYYISPKIALNNFFQKHFHIIVSIFFVKLNQTILLVYKDIEIFLLWWILFRVLDIFCYYT